LTFRNYLYQKGSPRETQTYNGKLETVRQKNII